MTLLDTWPLPEHPRLRDRLLAAYQEPTRHYHDVTHLAEVCAHLDGLMRPGDPDRDVVMLAAWFHDAVYDGERDDEERSAGLAETELAGLLSADVVAEVVRLVLLTTTHRPEPDDRRGQLLCDADLAILAAEEDRYAEYVASVRREFASLSDEDFAAGRSLVLQDLLAKDTLFHGARARELWEDRARANVAAELERLARV